MINLNIDLNKLVPKAPKLTTLSNTGDLLDPTNGEITSVEDIDLKRGINTDSKKAPSVWDNISKTATSATSATSTTDEASITDTSEQGWKAQAWGDVHADLTQKQLSRKMDRLQRNKKTGGERYKSMQRTVSGKGGQLTEDFGAWKGGKKFSETKIGDKQQRKEMFKNIKGKIGKLFKGKGK